MIELLDCLFARKPVFSSPDFDSLYVHRSQAQPPSVPEA